MPVDGRGGERVRGVGPLVVAERGVGDRSEG